MRRRCFFFSDAQQAVAAAAAAAAATEPIFIFKGPKPNLLLLQATCLPRREGGKSNHTCTVEQNKRNAVRYTIITINIE